MADYYAIITNTGKALEAAALASGTKITLDKFVVGDGNGQAQTPDPVRTALVHEVYRNSISDLTVSIDQPNQIIAQLVMPANVGGFTVREIGLLTAEGELYAIANCATFDKPVNGVSITMQFRLAVSDTDNVTLNVATGEGLFLRQDENLSDVKDKQIARQNLQLGSASTKDVGIFPGNVMQVGGFGLGAGPTDKSDAYQTQSQIYRVLSSAVNSPGNAIYGVISLRTDGAVDGGRCGYFAAGTDGSAYVGTSGADKKVNWGRIYTTKYKPTAAEVGAYPITGGVLQGTINALGSVGTQGGAFLIRNDDGEQVASISANSNGSISVYSDVTGRSFGIDGVGNFTTASGAFVCELGQRVYSPNNPPPNTMQLSVNGDGWWYRDLRTGMIFQGGFIAGSASVEGAMDRIPLNIAVPNRLLHVSTIIRNYAQGYQTTWNPQTRDLSGERNGFDWIHGAQEREVYWMAIGY